MAAALRGLAGLLRHVQGEPAATAYLLVGGDRRELEQGVAAFQSRLAGEGLAALGAARLRGAESSFAEVVDACATMALGGGTRLVLVHEPERLSGELDPLAAYLADPNPSTCLVFVPSTFDRRLKLSKLLESRARVVAFDPPGIAELPEWIAARLGAAGLRAEPEALDLLVDLVAAETLLLGNELEKLALYCGGAGVVKRADVEAVLGRSRAVEVFDLTNAIEDGRPADALAALRRLHEQRVAIPQLVGMLDWCAGRLLGTEPVRAPPQRQAALQRRAKALRGRFGEAYRRLREADRLFRTTGGDAEAALERAVLHLAGN